MLILGTLIGLFGWTNFTISAMFHYNEFTWKQKLIFASIGLYGNIIQAIAIYM